MIIFIKAVAFRWVGARPRDLRVWDIKEQGLLLATEFSKVRFVKQISGYPDPSSKRSNYRLTSPQGHSPLAPRAKTPPSSPFSIPRSATSTNLSSSLQVRPPLPHTNPLPTDRGALEGLLNHHASQLQKLADQVESVNEWIEMNGIVLEKLLSDVRYTLEKEAADRAVAVRASHPHICIQSTRCLRIPDRTRRGTRWTIKHSRSPTIPRQKHKQQPPPHPHSPFLNARIALIKRSRNNIRGQDTSELRHPRHKRTHQIYEAMAQRTRTKRILAARRVLADRAGNGEEAGFLLR